MGEGLLGPTLIHYGPRPRRSGSSRPIREGTELWCQGYSEPDAGSDLANVQTRAVRDGDEWVITGQKVWTSLAHQADWCFVVCRTDPSSARHQGLSYLLVPMDQPGIEVRPISQLTGTSEFNEVFFDGARTDADNVVGAVGDGWRVALATLAFERGVALLGHQLGFRRELDRIVGAGAGERRGRRPRPAPAPGPAHIELAIMRYNTLRSLSGVDGPVAPPEASIAKLYWGSWHRRLGELALDVLGPAATSSTGAARDGGYELGELQRSFLFARSETIYGGSNEIQRNIIGERVLGLPPEPKGGREREPGSSFDPPPPPPPPGRPRPAGRQGGHRDGGGRDRDRLGHGPALPGGGGGGRGLRRPRAASGRDGRGAGRARAAGRCTPWPAT